jgi:hypothetical protein
MTLKGENMYTRLIEKMSKKGVVFEKGLTKDEIKKVENQYSIIFPEELKNFYTMALPVSKGFYNWRDMSQENLFFINNAIDFPRKLLYENIDDIYWPEEWDEEPSTIQDKREILINRLSKAPQLIPIYSHRYLPSIYGEIQIPIMSIHGADIIYYGENLSSYFEIEFGIKSCSDIKYDDIPYITFWGDLL